LCDFTRHGVQSKTLTGAPSSIQIGIGEGGRKVGRFCWKENKEDKK
jgi:hypothetical protein